MTASTSGLHHVTAIAGEPQRNIDFYITGLGLRLVKKTVNFDDPGTYHLYYGDDSGRPGSLLTFFPWKGIPSGRIGSGQSTSTAFSVPQGSLGWWKDHFGALGVESHLTTESSEEERLTLRDPDGLQLDLVASSLADPRDPWDSASVPAEYAVRGQHSSVLTVADPTGTLEVLTRDLGMRVISENGNRTRVGVGDGSPGALVDIVADPTGTTGLTAGGTVHHIAFRTPDLATQELWRAELVDRGYGVTAILDRQYFTSIYFREPGGVLFEIATDTPGFAIDEPLLELGRSLKLPSWLEPSREQIEHAVAEIHVPEENNPAVENSPAVQEQPGGGVMTDVIADWPHLHQAGSPDRPVLLMLHGTGGSELDIAPLAAALDPAAEMLAPRGRVSENGLTRYFRRLAEGVFDFDDVVLRAGELADFIAAARVQYALGDRPVIAVGLSNGANIALATVLLHPDVLAGVVAFSGMFPLDDRPLDSDLAGTDVLLLNGASDPMAPSASVDRLHSTLSQRGASVTLERRPGGHGIAQQDLDAARAWLAAR